MTLQELLQTVKERNIALVADGDLLRYRAPEGALDDDLKDELRRHKPEILAVLKAREFDGHIVAEVLWETDKAVIFRDPDGNVWRRVHAWGATWPVTVVSREQ